MKKKIMIVLCMIAIMALFSGCSSGGSKEIYTTQNAQEKEAKEITDKFIKKIQKEDYDNIKSCIYIPDNRFIRDEDISWYIKRCGLADIEGMSKKRILLTGMEEGNANIDEANNANASSKNLTYTTEDGTDYTITAVQDKDNHWKVYMPDVYATNYSYSANKSLTTYINDIEVTSDYIDSNMSSDDNYVTYKIPYVPSKEFTIKTSDGDQVNVTSQNNNIQLEKTKKK